MGVELLASNDLLMEVVKLGEDWHLAGEVDHLVPVADIVHEFFNHRHVSFRSRDVDPVRLVAGEKTGAHCLVRVHIARESVWPCCLRLPALDLEWILFFFLEIIPIRVGKEIPELVLVDVPRRSGPRRLLSANFGEIALSFILKLLLAWAFCKPVKVQILIIEVFVVDDAHVLELVSDLPLVFPEVLNKDAETVVDALDIVEILKYFLLRLLLLEVFLSLLVELALLYFDALTSGLSLRRGQGRLALRLCLQQSLRLLILHLRPALVN